MGGKYIKLGGGFVEEEKRGRETRRKRMWVFVALKFSWNLQETHARKLWSLEVIFEKNKQPWCPVKFQSTPIDGMNRVNQCWELSKLYKELCFIPFCLSMSLLQLISGIVHSHMFNTRLLIKDYMPGCIFGFEGQVWTCWGGFYSWYSLWNNGRNRQTSKYTKSFLTYWQRIKIMKQSDGLGILLGREGILREGGIQNLRDWGIESVLQDLSRKRASRWGNNKRKCSKMVSIFS